MQQIISVNIHCNSFRTSGKQTKYFGSNSMQMFTIQLSSKRNSNNSTNNLLDINDEIRNDSYEYILAL